MTIDGIRELLGRLDMQVLAGMLAELAGRSTEELVDDILKYDLELVKDMAEYVLKRM